MSVVGNPFEDGGTHRDEAESKKRRRRTPGKTKTGDVERDRKKPRTSSSGATDGCGG